MFAKGLGGPFVSSYLHAAPVRRPLLLLRHPFYPFLVRKVPLDRFADAGFERVRRNPTELVFDLRRVNRVTTVVAGAIFHERDQLA